MSEEKKELKIKDLKKSLKIVDIIMLILFIFITAQTIMIVLLSNIVYTILSVIIFIMASFTFLEGGERIKELKKLGIRGTDEIIEEARKRMRELNE